MVDGRVHPATMPMSSPALNSAAMRGPGGQSAIDVASCRLDNRTDDVPNARPNPVAAQVYFEQAKTIRPHSTRWSPQPGGHSRTWLIVSATDGRWRRVRRCRSARAPHRGACYCQESHIWAWSTAPPGPKPSPTAPSHLDGQSGRRGSDQRSRHRDFGDAAGRVRTPQLYRAGSPNILCALRFRLHRIARAGPERVAWRQRRGVAPNRVIDILARGHSRVARLPGPAQWPVGETFGRTDRFGCRPEASTRSPNGSHRPRSCWCSLLCY